MASPTGDAPPTGGGGGTAPNNHVSTATDDSVSRTPTATEPTHHTNGHTNGHSTTNGGGVDEKSYGAGGQDVKAKEAGFVSHDETAKSGHLSEKGGGIGAGAHKDGHLPNEVAELTETSAKLENPLQGLSREQLIAEADTFCRDSDLNDKGALRVRLHSLSQKK